MFPEHNNYNRAIYNHDFFTSRGAYIRKLAIYTLINPRRACAARVTVLGSCVCCVVLCVCVVCVVCVCVCVCEVRFFKFSRKSRR